MSELARDFEATFLSLLLKEMRQTLEPYGLFAGDAGDVHGGLFDLYLGKHLAEAGGVGLAAALQSYLRPTTTTSPPAPDGISPASPVPHPASRGLPAPPPA